MSIFWTYIIGQSSELSLEDLVFLALTLTSCFAVFFIASLLKRLLDSTFRLLGYENRGLDAVGYLRPFRMAAEKFNLTELKGTIQHLSERVSHLPLLSGSRNTSKLNFVGNVNGVDLELIFWSQSGDRDHRDSRDSIVSLPFYNPDIAYALRFGDLTNLNKRREKYYTSYHPLKQDYPHIISDETILVNGDPVSRLHPDSNFYALLELADEFKPIDIVISNGKLIVIKSIAEMEKQFLRSEGGFSRFRYSKNERRKVFIVETINIALAVHKLIGNGFQ